MYTIWLIHEGTRPTRISGRGGLGKLIEARRWARMNSELTFANFGDRRPRTYAIVEGTTEVERMTLVNGQPVTVAA